MIHKLIHYPLWTTEQSHSKDWIVIHLQGVSLRYVIPNTKIKNVEMTITYEDEDAQPIDPDASVR